VDVERKILHARARINDGLIARARRSRGRTRRLNSFWSRPCVRPWAAGTTCWTPRPAPAGFW